MLYIGARLGMPIALILDILMRSTTLSAIEIDVGTVFGHIGKIGPQRVGLSVDLTALRRFLEPPSGWNKGKSIFFVSDTG